MSLDLIPADIHDRFHVEERGHACAILQRDFGDEFDDLLACLGAFRLRRTEILLAGGSKSTIAGSIDQFLAERGWQERRFHVEVVVDGSPHPTPTHKIDKVKSRVGIEVEWNNKDTFFDRDLNNFRILHQFGILSVGVIITRMTELQGLFNELGKGSSYGASTTHWDKLMPRVSGGGAGGCPLLLVGMGLKCYDPNA
jgi:hypothetical protein